MIKLFSEIDEQDRAQVGGKAFNQARLWQAQFNVPLGVVIPARAFTEFISEKLWIERALAIGHEPAFAEQLAQDIAAATLPESIHQELIDKLLTAFPKNCPQWFAVRSSAIGEDSAANSFAGIHRTLLGIGASDLGSAIMACWASALSPQAVEYRRERNLSLVDIQIAVLIQAMIMPQVAGVAFTIDPVSGNQQQMVINAAYGLGEALVSGQVEPDLYRVAKTPPQPILERLIGAKATRLEWQQGRLETLAVAPELRAQPALTDDQISALSEQLIKIEQCYHKPQDVEWAHDGAQLFILQARPITTTSQNESKPKVDILWSRANFREILPELPSPYSTGMMTTTEPDFAEHYRESGFDIEALRPTLKVIYGRPYFNSTMFLAVGEQSGVPTNTVLRMLGHGAEMSRTIEYRINYRQMLANITTVIRSMRRQTRFVPTRPQVMAETAAETADINSIAIDKISYAEILQTLEARRPYYVKFLFTAMSIASQIMGKLLFSLQLIGDAVSEPENFINAQIAVGEKNVSAQQGIDLLKLGEMARNDARCRDYFTRERSDFSDYQTALTGTQFLERFREFLQHYGHRAIYETDGALPRFYEDPTYLLHSIGNMVNADRFTAPEEIEKQQLAQAEREWQTLSQALRKRTIFAPFKLWLLRRNLREIKGLFALREFVRSEGMRAFAATRQLLLRIAQRLVREDHLDVVDDIFFLEPNDLQAAFSTGNLRVLRRFVAQRRARQQFYQRLDMPNLLRESEVELILRRLPERVSSSAKFQGLAVSTGAIEGEVVVLRSPAEFAKMKPGKILVAPVTDPAWTPLFAVAIGVIVELGGILSHGSIVAREYGLPTVVNIPGITKILRDGDRVLVDGSTGVVELINRNGNNGKD